MFGIITYNIYFNIKVRNLSYVTRTVAMVVFSSCNLKEMTCFQRTNTAREKRREHTVPAGRQQVGPRRQAARAAGGVPRARRALAGALRRDLRQDPRQRRQGACTTPTTLACLCTALLGCFLWLCYDLMQPGSAMLRYIGFNLSCQCRNGPKF